MQSHSGFPLPPPVASLRQTPRRATRPPARSPSGPAPPPAAAPGRGARAPPRSGGGRSNPTFGKRRARSDGTNKGAQGCAAAGRWLRGGGEATARPRIARGKTGAAERIRGLCGETSARRKPSGDRESRRSRRTRSVGDDRPRPPSGSGQRPDALPANGRCARFCARASTFRGAEACEATSGDRRPRLGSSASDPAGGAGEPTRQRRCRAGCGRRGSSARGARARPPSPCASRAPRWPAPTPWKRSRESGFRGCWRRRTRLRKRGGGRRGEGEGKVAARAARKRGPRGERSAARHARHGRVRSSATRAPFALASAPTGRAANNSARPQDRAHACGSGANS